MTTIPTLQQDVLAGIGPLGIRVDDRVCLVGKRMTRVEFVHTVSHDEHSGYYIQFPDGTNFKQNVDDAKLTKTEPWYTTRIGDGRHSVDGEIVAKTEDNCRLGMAAMHGSYPTGGYGTRCKDPVQVDGLWKSRYYRQSSCD